MISKRGAIRVNLSTTKLLAKKRVSTLNRSWTSRIKYRTRRLQNYWLPTNSDSWPSKIQKHSKCTNCHLCKVQKILNLLLKMRKSYLKSFEPIRMFQSSLKRWSMHIQMTKRRKQVKKWRILISNKNRGETFRIFPTVTFSSQLFQGIRNLVSKEGQKVEVHLYQGPQKVVIDWISLEMASLKSQKIV